MSFKHVIEMYEILDTPKASGAIVAKYFEEIGKTEDVVVKKVNGEQGSTDFIKILIRGENGKSNGGNAPTLGIIGRLGGLGARPSQIGFVSDGDGALACLSTAAKLSLMQKEADVLQGDVILCTHICPNAPTTPHEPVPFMGSPVGIAEMNKYEVSEEMDAILSIDTTKGNLIVNHSGYAITPTIVEGYILKVSNDLLDLVQQTSGKLPVTLPITTQDITPYGNGLFHVNSIVQPCTSTNVPVVGVAITTEVAVAGCATGATHLSDVEKVVRFTIETAKLFGERKCDFYDVDEFARIKQLYGSMSHLQTLGVKDGQLG
ncbi:DUF1177 domain-containing protein [Alteribacter populi]|uniref:DUF1177 domain-containing protein n=1 Tax=Alteribacter populi TaxID=2011011 RepID=UPI000BBA5790|nr:DUF1177 domain-containing protein [Alteribacter populi]